MASDSFTSRADLRFTREVRVQLVQIRENSGFSVDDVCKYANIKNAETLNRIESGDRDGRLPPLSRETMTRILDLLRISGDLRQRILGPYKFGELLELYIEDSDFRKIDLAKKLGKKSQGSITHLVNGTQIPTDPGFVHKLAQILGLDREKESKLLRAAGLELDNLNLENVPREDLVAVEELLSAAQDGIGAERRDLAEAPDIDSGIFNPRIALRRISNIRRSADIFLYNALDSEETVRIGIGDFFSASSPSTRQTKSSQSIEPIRGSLRHLLANGVSVRLLVKKPESVQENVDLIVDMLDCFGLGGSLDIRTFSPGDFPDPPLRGIQVGGAETLLFFPKERNDGDYSAHWFRDRSSIFSRHFDRRFEGAKPLLRFFGNSLADHVELEEAMLEAELTSEGRYVIKRDINSMMVPIDSCWDWECEYLRRKYDETLPEDPSGLFDRLKSVKLERISNLTYKLPSEKCHDICDRSAIEEFFLGDQSNSEKRAEPENSLLVLDTILKWLKHTKYGLALVSDWQIGNTAFEVSLGSSVFLQAWNSDGRDYHIQVFDPKLAGGFGGIFRRTWEPLKRVDKDPQLVSEFLKNIKRQIIQKNS